MWQQKLIAMTRVAHRVVTFKDWEQCSALQIACSRFSMQEYLENVIVQRVQVPCHPLRIIVSVSLVWRTSRSGIDGEFKQGQFCKLCLPA